MKVICIITLLILCFPCFAQQVEEQNEEQIPKLILDFMLVDAPYIKYGAQATANYQASVAVSQSTDPKLGHYLGAPFISPSMSGVISYASSFYNTMNYGVARGWDRILSPDKSKSAKIFNDIGTEFTAGIAFVLTTKVPFAGGWAHEEFHRNTWGPLGIGSYNQIWGFDLAPDALTYVGSIYDEDLIEFKKKDPAGFVRMGSAGIEAHYLMSARVQSQDFLYNTHLPNLALYWADFLAALDYVNRAHTTKTIDEHAAQYNDEPDQLKRDFTGNDFTAWVYDLYNGDEAYADRGIHPSGIGIDRYRDYNDLSVEMLDYVKKIGNRQWLNVISPFMFRVREIKLNESLSFNFALRHYLTSFGDDTQLDIFINKDNKKSILSLHKYSNHDTEWLPGIELTKYMDFLSLDKEKTLQGSIRGMIWMQPEDQLFFTKNSQAGGLLSCRLNLLNRSIFQPYLEIESKTKGWVAGVTYLNGKTSVRFGIQAVL